ncbi:hypothetical protein [Maribacter sp. 2307ULW6-5]|uniref:hypothetical protein n=1 Tax=Maribacter sp. 2307ULW6-5 TaxID=3386275 RepID=UPI0039BD5022
MAEESPNPFKALQKDLKTVPPELRKKVMSDVAMAKLIMEMATLFTSNYANLFADLMKTNKK